MGVLSIFATARQRSVLAAVRAKEEWPREWMADVHAAYSILAQHPYGSDAHVVNHYDFLVWMGGSDRSGLVLEEGLARFPESFALHDRFRTRVLREEGVDALEARYTDMVSALDAPPNARWFAGLASIFAAEQYRREGTSDAALASYERALSHFDAQIELRPETAESSDHYAAMALGGIARVYFEAGDDPMSLAYVLDAFRRKEAAAASLDGLVVSTVGTAKNLLARLTEREDAQRAATLQAALDALDPVLLELPEFERGGRPSPDARRRGGGRPGRGAAGPTPPEPGGAGGDGGR